MYPIINHGDELCYYIYSVETRNLSFGHQQIGRMTYLQSRRNQLQQVIPSTTYSPLYKCKYSKIVNRGM